MSISLDINNFLTDIDKLLENKSFLNNSGSDELFGNSDLNLLPDPSTEFLNLNSNSNGAIHTATTVAAEAPHYDSVSFSELTLDTIVSSKEILPTETVSNLSENLDLFLNHQDDSKSGCRINSMLAERTNLSSFDDSVPTTNNSVTNRCISDLNAMNIPQSIVLPSTTDLNLHNNLSKSDNFLTNIEKNSFITTNFENTPNVSLTNVLKFETSDSEPKAVYSGISNLNPNFINCVPSSQISFSNFQQSNFQTNETVPKIPQRQQTNLFTKLFKNNTSSDQQQSQKDEKKQRPKFISTFVPLLPEPTTKTSLVPLITESRLTDEIEKRKNDYKEQEKKPKKARKTSKKKVEKNKITKNFETNKSIPSTPNTAKEDQNLINDSLICNKSKENDVATFKIFESHKVPKPTSAKNNKFDFSNDVFIHPPDSLIKKSKSHSEKIINNASLDILNNSIVRPPLIQQRVEPSIEHISTKQQQAHPIVQQQVQEISDTSELLNILTGGGGQEKNSNYVSSIKTQKNKNSKKTDSTKSKSHVPNILKSSRNRKNLRNKRTKSPPLIHQETALSSLPDKLSESNSNLTQLVDSLNFSELNRQFGNINRVDSTPAFKTSLNRDKNNFKFTFPEDQKKIPVNKLQKNKSRDIPEIISNDILPNKIQSNLLEPKSSPLQSFEEKSEENEKPSGIYRKISINAKTDLNPESWEDNVIISESIGAIMRINQNKLPSNTIKDYPDNVKIISKTNLKAVFQQKSSHGIENLSNSINKSTFKTRDNTKNFAIKTNKEKPWEIIVENVEPPPQISKFNSREKKKYKKKLNGLRSNVSTEEKEPNEPQNLNKIVKEPKYKKKDKLLVLANDILKLKDQNFTIKRDEMTIELKDTIARKHITYRLFEAESLGMDSNQLSQLTNAKSTKIRREKLKSTKKPAVPILEIEKIKPIIRTRFGRILKPTLPMSNLCNKIYHKNDSFIDIIQDLKDKDFKPRSIVNFKKQKVATTILPKNLEIDKSKELDRNNKYQKELNNINLIQNQSFYGNQHISVVNFSWNQQGSSLNLQEHQEKQTGHKSQFVKLEEKLSPAIAKYKCPSCNKLFMGKRLQKHYGLFPDHNPNLKESKNFLTMSLYKFLVEKVKNSSDNEDNRTEVFLNEISDLVEQLQLRSSKLVRSTSGIHLVNSKSCKILGIPEGHYSIDVNSIEAAPDPVLEEPAINKILAPPPPQRLDFSMSLDDTITAKLNLSDHGNAPSEESLLRNSDFVNDLVQTNIDKLDEKHLHYDQCDNAVEAMPIKINQTQILDLSYIFNNN